MTALERALIVATEAHTEQTRDGDPHLPYITHPIEVMLVLRRIAHIESPPILIAAILHDTLEETPLTEAAIRQEFGPEVATLVRQLTRSEPAAAELENLDKDARYALRTKHLLDGIRDMSPEAMIIKLADRLVNLREGQSTRKPRNWQRYCAQTDAVLALIPREICPPLWDAVHQISRV
ncbi:MAG: HD domain-containing protein [Fimbriimonadaceae bacterium]|nr:HD domain-containing protein [Fimbriimonadaceae bacterium]